MQRRFQGYAKKLFIFNEKKTHKKTFSLISYGQDFLEWKT